MFYGCIQCTPVMVSPLIIGYTNLIVRINYRKRNARMKNCVYYESDDDIDSSHGNAQSQSEKRKFITTCRLVGVKFNVTSPDHNRLIDVGTDQWSIQWRGK